MARNPILYLLYYIHMKSKHFLPQRRTYIPFHPPHPLPSPYTSLREDTLHTGIPSFLPPLPTSPSPPPPSPSLSFFPPNQTQPNPRIKRKTPLATSFHTFSPHGLRPDSARSFWLVEWEVSASRAGQSGMLWCVLYCAVSVLGIRMRVYLLFV